MCTIAGSLHHLKPIPYTLNPLPICLQGQLSRHVSSTQMNKESSRSHLIMSVVIESTNLQTQHVTRGKLSFVDLAGSERWAIVQLNCTGCACQGWFKASSPAPSSQLCDGGVPALQRKTMNIYMKRSLDKMF